MPLILNPDEIAFITALDAPLDQSLAEGVSMPGGIPETIPELQGYKDLKTNDPRMGDQKALTKNVFKQTYAALISLFRTFSAYRQITSFSGGFSLWGDVNYGQGQVRYYKNILGEVRLQGLVRTPGTSPGANQTMFTLPTGYRLAAQDAQIFACAHNDGFCSIQVNPDGAVIFRGTPTANSWVSVTLSFRAG